MEIDTLKNQLVIMKALLTLVRKEELSLVKELKDQIAFTQARIVAFS